MEAFHGHLQRSDCYYDCMQVGQDSLALASNIRVHVYAHASELFRGVGALSAPVRVPGPHHALPQKLPYLLRVHEGSRSDGACHTTH